MTQKIEWNIPDELTVGSVEISRATDKFGAYSVIGTVIATDDGLVKGASNSWVTSSTDSSGAKSNWYKIRFYDGTNYSDFSDPVTGREDVNLCTLSDVKEVIDTVGRFTDTDINDAIVIIDKEIYNEMGTPTDSIWSYIGYDSGAATTYKTYYVGEENIYRVDRVFHGTTTRHEIFLDDGYKVNKHAGMVRILPYASSGFTPDRSSSIEIQYVPNIYNRVATYRTAKLLLEKIDNIRAGKPSKELEVITNQLNAQEQNLINRTGIIMSSQFKNYDTVYGVNKRNIRQDFDRNKYLGSYGFDT